MGVEGVSFDWSYRKLVEEIEDLKKIYVSLSDLKSKYNRESLKRSIRALQITLDSEGMNSEVKKFASRELEKANIILGILDGGEL